MPGLFYAQKAFIHPEKIIRPKKRFFKTKTLAKIVRLIAEASTVI